MLPSLPPLQETSTKEALPRLNCAGSVIVYASINGQPLSSTTVTW